MKKRIYFILFLFYFPVLGFILHLNGVFTGKISSYENLFINIAFLLLIGILFILSAFSFARLNRCTDILSAATDSIYESYKETGTCLWEEYKDREEAFGHPVLDQAFNRYRIRIKSYYSKWGLRQTCDLEEYINEDLLDQIGASHYNSSLSGTMTGLGILGTFLGLSLGLSAFSGDDIFTIADNVGPLLGGMKVAFHTSIYGILFSLIFTFVYRSIMTCSYEILSDFLLCYRECVMPPAADTRETAGAMLVYQANMANSMKDIQKLLQGQAIEQTQGLERIVQEFTHRLSLSMGADFEKLGQALTTACESQAYYSQNYQTMEATTRELLEANRILLQTLDHTMQRQEMFSKELAQQQQQLSAACNTLNEEISNQLYTFDQMRNLYEK